MIGQENRNEDPSRVQKIPEARYAYYRRCQVFRRNGEQCKAPAEKGAHICHAHAGEQATALRRRLELMVVLAEAVRRMRARGKPQFEIADIFTDFNAIQITLAVMAQALIDGRIDCKTAGRLAVGLQTAAKLLRMVHHKGTSTAEARRHREGPKLPQICADDRRLSKEKTSTTNDTKEHEGISGDLAIGRSGHRSSVDREAPLELSLIRRGENASFAGIAGTLKQEQGTLRNGSAHGPPEWARAA
ncbi:MAG TPA: hypothetical protein VKL99_12805 [Candidatus Angelobacter sp.]|nr:hypothetical protein [Candidatus Angelobacter sp.]